MHPNEDMDILHTLRTAALFFVSQSEEQEDDPPSPITPIL